jgi:hypothetical protein
MVSWPYAFMSSGTLRKDGKNSLKKRLFQPSHVIIICSKSDKLIFSLVRYWRDKYLILSVDKRCRLLSDSYLGQNDLKNYKDVKSKSVERILIPRHSTSGIQLLDRYFDRQMKIFIGRLYHHVALEQLGINL